MRSEVIKADSIDAAVERILDELKEDDTAQSTSSRKNNVIYFDGWDGLGASAVLRAVAQRLAVASKAPAGLKFDQIIHIDCSKWEGRRALQRAIAEQLELPAPLMEMFDLQDEEDEFKGLSMASRPEIPQVLRGMHRRIQDLNRRFLVIFHNGSSEEIDLAGFGFPMSQYLDNKVLWTFQGRFRLYPRNKVVGDMKSTAGTSMTGVFLSARHSFRGREPQELCTDLVLQEAAEVVAESDIMVNTSNGPAQVGEQFILHMLKLCCIGHNLLMDYDLATHACNFWICDGILQHHRDDTSTDGEDYGLWRAAGALQSEMRLDASYYQHEPKYFPSQLVRYGMSMMPDKTLPPNGFLVIPAGAIPNADMLQDFNKISVLKLSRRTFSFSSPPFIYCHNLKFLWLDHCQDQDHSSTDGFPQEEEKITTDGAGTKDEFQCCFQRLWVLDVRYTCCDQILSAKILDFMTQLRELNVMGAQDWDICQLQGRLPNIRKLRVTKSALACSGHNLFLGMSKMELLDLSGNRSRTQGMTNLSGICTSSNHLETVMIIDGSTGIQKFSFKGCAKLKNLLLSGLFGDLHVLDLSGTMVKTLDLSAMIAHNIDKLFLDNCKELCAILWPPPPPEAEWKYAMAKLHIDTTEPAASLVSWEEKPTEGRATPTAVRTPSVSLSVVYGDKVPSEFNWCIMVRDARLLGSLVPLIQRLKYPRWVHVKISSGAIAFGSGKDNEAVSSSMKRQDVLGNVEEPEHYEDVAVAFKDHLLVQASEGDDGDAPTLAWVWPCPHVAYSDELTCYMHIQDHKQVRRTQPMQEGEVTIPAIPDTLCDIAQILHVHDSLAITSIPCPLSSSWSDSVWGNLKWCRVERCPNLECVFTTPQSRKIIYIYPFKSLETFWASRLIKAQYIWNWMEQAREIGDSFFEPLWMLTLLHLDFCPRMIYAFPRFLQVDPSIFYEDHLQTLEIAWCGALKEVFTVWDTDLQKQEPDQKREPDALNRLEFTSLKHIHLHELPMLEGICGRRLIYAPRLETVKIRGCWSLRHLPAVGYERVHCDCEKEWWDRLEWRGLDMDHHPSMYQPTHPQYYKKTMLKGSVLI